LVQSICFLFSLAFLLIFIIICLFILCFFLFPLVFDLCSSFMLADEALFYCYCLLFGFLYSKVLFFCLFLCFYYFFRSCDHLISVFLYILFFSYSGIQYLLHLNEESKHTRRAYNDAVYVIFARLLYNVTSQHDTWRTLLFGV
jgi:hypothetical protein